MICKHCGQVVEDAIQIPKNGHQISIKFPEECVIGTLELDGESIPVYLSREKAEQLGRVPGCYGRIMGFSVSNIKRVFEFVEA